MPRFDWLLRDVLQLSLLGSIWDELLLLVGFVWALYQRASAQKPLRSRVSGAGLGVGLYLLIGLVLLVWTWSAPVSVSISGFRASMRYLLLFYLVIDLLRDRADLLLMTKVIVLLGTLIALYGVAQYLLGVEIPSNWTDQAETAVRTRVFSIFSNPNILGGYLVLVTPITVGMAYTVEAPAEKVFYWLCALCMCLACLFTMTRGAWFALVVAAVCFALIVDRRLLLLMLVGGIAACFLPFVRSRIGYLFTDAFVGVEQPRRPRRPLGPRLLAISTAPATGRRGWASAVTAAPWLCRTRSIPHLNMPMWTTITSRSSRKTALSASAASSPQCSCCSGTARALRRPPSARGSGR